MKAYITVLFIIIIFCTSKSRAFLFDEPGEKFPVWALFVASGISLALGIFMGANNVSNAFGANIQCNANVVGLAYIAACLIEVGASILSGYNGLRTPGLRIVQNISFKNEEHLLYFGQIAILVSSIIWIATATKLRIPVSTTQALVGSSMGMAFVMQGLEGIRWNRAALTFGFWFFTPICSGILSLILYTIIDRFILRARNAYEKALKLLPFFYFLCVTAIVFITAYNATNIPSLKDKSIPFTLIIALWIGLGSAILVQYWYKPRLCKKYGNPKDVRSLSIVSVTSHIFPSSPYKKPVFDISILPHKRSWFKILFPAPLLIENIKVYKLFKSLQILSSTFVEFSYALGDVSNAFKPLARMLNVYYEAKNLEAEETNFSIVVFGIFGVLFAICLYGFYTVETISSEFTDVNACCGFSIELGAGFTAHLASKFNLQVCHIEKFLKVITSFVGFNNYVSDSFHFGRGFH
uniref:Phosphate transporter n=1 Tax=Rhabditophanes sp. KR3021 TaxID=114890 RepID=A0AC35TQH6_9BILA